MYMYMYIRRGPSPYLQLLYLVIYVSSFRLGNTSKMGGWPAPHGATIVIAMRSTGIAPGAALLSQSDRITIAITTIITTITTIN